MEIRQLQYFIEVARQRSYTKAAQTLHVTQPTLSKMVKNLEDELEVTLIDRSAKRISLTDAGEVVFAQAQKVVNSIEDLSISLYDTMSVKKGRITIGLPPVISTLFFPRIIAEFQQQFPDVTISLTEVGAQRVEEKVLEGEVDLGFVLLPVDENKFDSIEFVHQEIKLLVHKSHPLAERNMIDLIELKNDPFLLLSKEFTLNSRTIEVCIEEGFTPQIAYESSQWDFIVGMVSKNLGVTLMPEQIGRRVADPDVRMVNLSKPFPWVLGIISAKNRYMPYATKEFIKTVRGLHEGW
ncbi:LysR family transcriptional regulator [Jeotgalibacillus haloalkalitolerans]|uniref:LysR family transcriptional regulator n=1 Tax=Jeotgalibacillus haloalkalitolerans TaxID=3104292 RepID=A0ABU5KI72_9BACL|nr:LysR family transcriptional regulator [Jeotgalibacillus sp. HH7-29]MDZ5710928.1 LysR family transcriptional regulator [Jeotgalibacillus sp. HH7-29]